MAGARATLAAESRYRAGKSLREEGANAVLRLMVTPGGCNTGTGGVGMPTSESSEVNVHEPAAQVGWH